MRRERAFTLVELILVMALLCVILGIAAPSLSRSMRQRNLTQEATRLLALTEYARDEAVSRGVPMVVWVDVTSGHFGARAMDGYEDTGAREKEFTLLDGLHFAPQEGLPASAESDAAEFTTDGTLDPSSLPSLSIVDRTNSTIEIDQTSDAWGYEIARNKE